MRFKRHPNEIKPPPISLPLSLFLVAKGAERLIRDFSSVAWYPCLHGKTGRGWPAVGWDNGCTYNITRGFWGAPRWRPSSVVLRRFRGASESLSSWRQLAKKRTGWPWKNCPPFQEGYWCIRGMEKAWKESFLPRGMEKFARCVSFDSIRYGILR